jgi:uncharacterized iron-regulated membrane protein
MSVAGYMIGGEAHSNLREGVPTLAVGALVATAGVVSLVVGMISYWRRRGREREVPPR